MKEMNDEWQKELHSHKAAIGQVGKIPKGEIRDKENRKLIAKAINSGKDLAMHYADYKCQNRKCKNGSELTYHHLIERYTKTFMDKSRYMSQRHYWANITILCTSCHSEMHDNKHPPEKMGSISPRTIKRIKKKFGVEK